MTLIDGTGKLVHAESLSSVTLIDSVIAQAKILVTGIKTGSGSHTNFRAPRTIGPDHFWCPVHEGASLTLDPAVERGIGNNGGFRHSARLGMQKEIWSPNLALFGSIATLLQIREGNSVASRNLALEPSLESWASWRTPISSRRMLSRSKCRGR